VSRLWSRKATAVTPYVPGEQPQDRRYIKLNTNENPYPPSPAVEAALRGFEPATLRLYPDPASHVLRAALSERHGLSPDRIFVGNGSDEILAFAFQAFFDPAPEGTAPDPAAVVFFPDVTYTFYPVYAGLYGIPFRTVPLAEDFSVPVDAFLAPCGGVVLANPNAPTGRALRLVDLERIAAAHPDRVVVVDEAYVDFGCETSLPLLDRFDNVLVVQTMSKARSLAGLRLGYAFGSRALAEGLERIRDSFNSYTIDRLAQTLAVAALSDETWYERTRGEIVRTRERTARRLVKLGFDVVPSAANFLFAKPPKLGGAALYEALKERGILVRYFRKPRIDGFVRITVGTPEEMDALIVEVARILGGTP
jgi:histidinol-phosphate aminotransferase